MPIIIVIIAIIAVFGVGGYLLKSNTPEAVAPTDTSARPEEMVEVSDAGTIIENTTDTSADTTSRTIPTAETNTYFSRGEYLTPARTNHTIDVTLTLAGDVVTDASIIYDDGAGFSNPHQERFDGAYKAQVVGKRLDEINLSRVGGASVTSRSFNEVIAEIEAQISA